MELVARQYRDQVEFLFIYTKEVHPDVVPFLVDTSEQGGTRVAAALAMKARFNMERRLLMDAAGRRSLQRHFGNHADAVLVIGVDGRLALLLPWSNARVLDDFLGPFLAGGGRFQASLASAVPETKIDISETMRRMIDLGQQNAYRAASLSQ